MSEKAFPIGKTPIRSREKEPIVSPFLLMLLEESKQMVSRFQEEGDAA